jgi:hypothetical protein
VYDALLGDAWRLLPDSIRTLHEAGTVRRAEGLFRVRIGTNVIARLIARIGGMPPAAEAVAVTLVVTPQPDGEEWRRTFGGALLVSSQRLSGGSIVERFGAVEVTFTLEADDSTLRYVFEGGSIRLLGVAIPLPLDAAAHERARAGNDIGSIDVSVDVAMKPFGRIVAYDGTLTRIEFER